MGLHMVALAKFHGLRPAMVTTGMVCSVLKLLMGFRIWRDEAVHQSRLFLFRLGHIAFNRDTPLSTTARLERALRLIWGALPSNTSSTSAATATAEEEMMEIGDDTYHSLSISEYYFGAIFAL
ncbi:hypothetical protein PIB30_062776 [Stylosanthes scabra]|uniref:Uncharacterized protein n=1 Tax=Stylosanthes scabra TaxID=79078 RepID=A0ABU6YKL9_9FABA|nr:hypothetical protein [Stylosanthes scabra]